jgi:hypothetical protein
MDQLSEIVGNLPVPEARVSCNQSRLQVVTYTFLIQDVPSVNGAAFTPLADARSMRRPMLTSIRQIDSIRDLVPFFSHVSISSYESVYASGGIIDWEAVERGLVEDMFDGR